jgi:hypothetical protein
MTIATPLRVITTVPCASGNCITIVAGGGETLTRQTLRVFPEGLATFMPTPV